MHTATMLAVFVLLGWSTVDVDAVNGQRLRLEPDATFHLRDGWLQAKGGAATTSIEKAMISTTVALKLTGVQEMEEELVYLSDPASPGFGQPHWSLPTLASKVYAPAAAVAAVRHWLTETCGGVITQAALNRGLMSVDFGVQQAEECFNVTLLPFYHAGTGRTTLCSVEQYTVPASVGKHLDFVAGRWPSDLPAHPLILLTRRR